MSQLLLPCLLHEAKALCAHYEHCVMLGSLKSLYCNCFAHSKRGAVLERVTLYLLLFAKVVLYLLCIWGNEYLCIN